MTDRIPLARHVRHHQGADPVTDIPQGEDVLAYLDRAISEREAAARAVSYDTFETHKWGWGATHLVLVHGEQRDIDAEMAPELAVHIVLNDPASVLRRCAADRKLLELHAGRAHTCAATDYDGDYDDQARFYDHEACPVVRTLAEGYGWTEGER